MATATFFQFRHRTASSTKSVDMPDLSNDINKALHETIKTGDTFRFDDLKTADQNMVRRTVAEVPDVLVVREITFEPNLEIENGIRKIYLEKG